MVARFGKFNVWRSNEVRGKHGCGIWKSILKMTTVFWNFMRLKLGSGMEIKLWEDVWVGDAPFKGLIPSICWPPIDSCLSPSLNFEGNIWCPIFRHNLFGWEVEEMVGILSVVEELKPDTSKRDSWEWVLNRKGNFMTKSLYWKFVNQSYKYFPHKFIWIPGIPSKVLFLFGTLTWIKSLPLTICRAEAEIWLTYV